MADNLDYINNKYTPTQGIGQEIENLVTLFGRQRHQFERRWYDNNFFDDGYHFRYLSRQTGKIIDQSDSKTMNLPMRSIPKASRQLRGIANLLLAPTYNPVIYPEKVSKANFPDQVDEQGMVMPNEEYMAAVDASKNIAKRTGHWVQEEWHNQRIWEKIILMVLLAGRHGVSYMQIWKDAYKEAIKTEVYDAFDLYLMGNLKSIYDSPAIIKAFPELIEKIKSNESFDPAQVAQLNPDNRYASSELKDAYSKSRFGMGENDTGPTVVLKEAFIKEYLNKDNFQEIAEKAGESIDFTNKKPGDCVIRHVFSAAGIWLKDEYTDLPDYPFVDFRFEPGPIYQKALIENFIPANKSLDIAVSRVERWLNTMVTGTWMKRKGENFEINNIPGGQVLEYDATPPTQGDIKPLPNTVFNYIELLNGLIEEQGAATSALGALPAGVKSGIAIESVKQTEYANLKIPSDQLKDTVRRITEKMIDIAADFVDPQTVHLLEKGEPEYFEVMGQRGIDVREEVGEDTSEYIPIKKGYRVNIEVESGLGFTMEGKKQTIQQIIGFIVPLAQMGVLNPESLKVLVQKALETYQFGSTQEFMEALDNGASEQLMNEDQIDQMKIAVLEVLNEAGVVGPQKDEQLVDSTKVGVLEAAQDMASSKAPVQTEAAPQGNMEMPMGEGEMMQ